MLKKWIATALGSSLLLSGISLLPEETIASLRAYAADDTQVVLNEICAQNKSAPAPDGECYDYIELYNKTETELDLSGWGISDKASKPFRYTIPAGTVIPAQGHLLIYCDSKAENCGALAAGFGLSVSGETVTLTNADGVTVDTVTFGTMLPDIAYGRYPDGSDQFVNMTLTPDAGNDSASVYVSPPTFSAGSGFYDAEFDLTLSCDEGDTIYYTLDGSDPTTSATAMVYSEAISIYDRSSEPNVVWSHAFEDGATAVSLSEYSLPPEPVDKATIVRAVSQNADGTFSRITTNSYFVDYANKSYDYANSTVISIVTDPDNLYNPDTGIYVVGNQYYEWKNSDAYNSSVDANPWNVNIPANFYESGKDWERPANITFFKNGETVHTQDLGIRIHGSSTCNAMQKSFNFYARSEYGDSKIRYDIFDGQNLDANGKKITKYDSFTLRRISNFNIDATSSELVTGRTNATLKSSKLCPVFLDGEFWGYYFIQEKTSKYYLESHYDIPEDDIAMIKQYELKEGTAADNQEFDALCRYVNSHDMSVASNYEYVCSQMDVDSLIDFFCIGIYLGTWDWPNWNFGVWRNNGAVDPDNPYSDGKWRFISYDLDYTQGSTYETYGSLTGYSFDYLSRVLNERNNSYPGWLLSSLMKNSEFKQKFAITYQDYCNGIMAKEVTLPLIQQTYEDNLNDMISTFVISWAVKNTTINRGYIQNYIDGEQEQRIAFFENRTAYAMPQLKSNLGLTGKLHNVTLRNDTTSGTVTVNTIQPTFTDGSWNAQYYADYPITLTAEPLEGHTFSHWRITDKDGTTAVKETSITYDLSRSIIVEAVYDTPALVGDANLDDTISLPDMVTLQKYLIRQTEFTEAQFTAADLQTDTAVNVLDLVRLKSMLLYPEVPEEIVVNLAGRVNDFTFNALETSAGTMQIVEENNELIFTTTALGEHAWAVQAYSQLFTLEQGKTYQLQFDAYADRELQITLGPQHHTGTYDTYCDMNALLTTEKQTFTYDFTMEAETDPVCAILIVTGYEVGTVSISNLTFIEVE